ncbi:MAG: winged helix DNA-binding protein [Pseudomonadota bacterium]
MGDSYMTRSEMADVLTRTELAMISTLEAFSRWTVFLNKAVSDAALAHQDIWILHSIRMRGGAQNLSEILLFLNRNDVSSIQYSLKKLERHGLVERVVGNSKREAGYMLTQEGEDMTQEYATLRDQLLLDIVSEQTSIEGALMQSAQTMERLTGLYDQATQVVLNRKILEPSAFPEGSSAPQGKARVKTGA